MAALEGKVDDLVNTCTRIETKLENMAGKTYVLWILGMTAATLVLSMLAHLVIRSFTTS